MVTNGWPSFCYYTSTLARHLLFCPCCLWLNRYLLSCILPALHILWNFSSYPVSREGRKEVMGSVDRNWHELVAVHHCRHHHGHPTWSASLIFEELHSTVFFNCHRFPFLRPKILLGKVPLSLYCRTFKSDVAQDVYCVFRCFGGKRNWHYCSIVAYLSKHCIAVHWSGAGSQL